MNSHPASFPLAPADALVNKIGHQKEQASCGVFGRISNGANGQSVGNYSDPQATVFIDRESHAGAWVKFLRDKGEVK